MLDGMLYVGVANIQLHQAYILRINQANPVLHPINEINPDAISIARELDAERASGSVRG